MRLAVDIGGTFTDLVALDDDGTISNVKVLTTPEDPARGFLDAVSEFLAASMFNSGRVKLVTHATTLASNALLTGNLPTTVLVTTQGFRDVLEIGRQNRPELYNLQVERPRPLVPRRYRFEVDERMAYDGTVLKRLNTSDSEKVARKVQHSGARSVAICLLHSYANPTHERALEKTFKKLFPNVRTTVSSKLLPEFREYERTSTTVVNACLQPIVSKYLEQLLNGLRDDGVNAPFYMMQSNGGTISSDQAIDQPARVIESGPVAGAVAARYYGALSKAGSVISLDVGGTTSKAGVWTQGRFELTTDYEVGGRLHGIRRVEGSGYPVRFPQVDLVEVGTGGGSIAKVDTEGVLHVGPESAGADPGPACYGKKGVLPTLTDAHVVLGRLSTEHLLAGRLKVQPTRAEEAIRKHVSVPLKKSVRDSAYAILTVAIDNMAGALRAASVERGLDPRGMLLIAFGGAGPMHAAEVARQLEIKRVLVPPAAGLFSSLGLLLAVPTRDYVQTLMIPLKNASPKTLEGEFRDMEARGLKALSEQGVNSKSVSFERYLDVRYGGQAFELSIMVPGKMSRQGLARAAKEFHVAHKAKYGYSDKTLPLELVNLRVNCLGPASSGLSLARLFKKTGTVPTSRRMVTYLEEGPRESIVYIRGSLPQRFLGRGPAVIEDYDSTAVIPPNTTFNVDRYGSIVMQVA